MENAKIQKSKCDILSNFQTMWMGWESIFETDSTVFKARKNLGIIIMEEEKSSRKKGCIVTRVSISSQKWNNAVIHPWLLIISTLKKISILNEDFNKSNPP